MSSIVTEFGGLRSCCLKRRHGVLCLVAADYEHTGIERRDRAEVRLDHLG